MQCGQPARAEYIRRLGVRWSNLAYLCRYAHQDIYRLLGRDPIAEPLSALELALFIRCTQEHWNEEVEKRNPLDPRPTDD